MNALGAQFADLVRRALVSAQELGGYRNVNVIPDISLVDARGRRLQFDLYWEFEMDGVTYRRIIECKVGNISDVQVIVSKTIRDLNAMPGVRAILALPYSVQDKMVESFPGIDMMTVRTDGISGSSIVPRRIDLNVTCQSAPELKSFTPFLSKDTSTHVHGIDFLARAGEVEIVDHDGCKTTLASDMENAKGRKDDDGGDVVYCRDMPNGGVLSVDGFPDIVITGYAIRYRPGVILKRLTSVAPEVLSVLEYIHALRASGSMTL